MKPTEKTLTYNPSIIKEINNTGQPTVATQVSLSFALILMGIARPVYNNPVHGFPTFHGNSK